MPAVAPSSAATEPAASASCRCPSRRRRRSRRSAQRAGRRGRGRLSWRWDAARAAAVPGPFWQAGCVTQRRTVVVGAGIAGLAAAHELAAAGDDVLVLEGSASVGGKLRRAEVAGVTVDVGAEAMLNRRPEAVDLARSLGLDLVHPATISSRIWTRGALRPLPRSVMGVPADLDELARTGVLSEDGIARARAEVTAPAPDEDVSVAAFVADRLGRGGRRPAGRAAARRGVRRPRALAVGAGHRPAGGGAARPRAVAGAGRRDRAARLRRAGVRRPGRRDRRPGRAARRATAGSRSAPTPRSASCGVRPTASSWSSGRPPLPRC